MKTFIQEFGDFVRQAGVVGLAVGLAIGTAAGSTVKAIVSGFIDPIVGFIVGGGDLEGQSWNTGLSRGGEDLVFNWGAILSSCITLVATAFVIYFIIHKAGLDRLDVDKSKEDTKRK